MVLGFDLGADDYVIKPFRNRELVSRIRNVLRGNRKNPAADLWKYCGGTGHGQSLSARGTDRRDKAGIQNPYDFIFPIRIKFLRARKF